MGRQGKSHRVHRRPSASPSTPRSLSPFALLAIVAVGLVGLSFAAPGEQAPAGGGSPPKGPIHLLTLKGSVNPITKDYVVRHVQEAQLERASLIVIQLDTPGGLVNSTKEIVDALLNSQVPVVVWVGPAGAWAASAGTFITLAAHVAAMAEGATLGAAHPVSLAPSSAPSARA